MMMRYALWMLTVFAGCGLSLVDGRLNERDYGDTAAVEEEAALSTTTALAVNYNNISMCERIHPEDLPAECLCREKPPLGLVVECLKVFNSSYFNDTIGLKIDLDPCNPEGSSCSIDVTERNNNIDYPIERIKAGEERDFPIPGLAVVVPGLGHVGMDVAVYIAGNPSMLILKIGLNACVALAQQTVCASSIPGLNTILPWYVLSGVYSFGDICDAAHAAAEQQQQLLAAADKEELTAVE